MRYVGVLILSLAFISCKGSLIQPGVPSDSIVLAVTVTPSPPALSSVDTIHAAAFNQGTTTGYYLDGCGAGLTLQLIDPDSVTVYLSNPRLRPLCPVFPAPLPPGQSIAASWQFTGTLFDSTGAQFPAKSGTYFASVGLFVGKTGQPTPDTLLMQSVSFQWKAQ